MIQTKFVEQIKTLHTTCLWRWNRVFRNVGIYNSDAGELPKRKYNIYNNIFILELNSLPCAKAASLQKFRDHIQTHWDTLRHSAGLSWTRDRHFAETCTRQNTSLTWDRHPCPRRDSIPFIFIIIIIIIIIIIMSASERPQTLTLDGPATGIGFKTN